MNKELKFIPEFNKVRARGVCVCVCVCERARESEVFFNDLVNCKIIFYGGGSGRMKYTSDI